MYNTHAVESAMTRRSLILLALLSTSGPAAIAQQPTESSYDPAQQFSAAELRADFALLRASIEEGHAGLYRYSIKAEMDSVFDATENRIAGPMTEAEYLLLLAPMIAAVNDGHTRWNSSRECADYLEEQSINLPFKLRFLDGVAYLHRNYSDLPDALLGARLISINGVGLDDIVDGLLPLISSDGRIETSKYRALESTTTFGRLYSLLYGITTSFELVYLTPGSQRPETVTVDGLTDSELNERFRARYPELADPGPPIELDYGGDIAIITVRTFGGGAYQNAGIDYPRFLRATFEEFQQKDIRNLIIDVRDNGGGSDVFGKLLFAYLTDEEFEYYRSLEVKGDHFDFLQHTNAADEAIPEERLRANDHGTYDLLGHPNLGVQSPLAPKFNGDVYVLMNGRSFSATGEFTSVAHYHGVARFAGEEGGAGYYGNTSGFVPTLTLTNTGIRVGIPMVRYTMAVSGYEPADRGLIPDIPINPTIEDVLSGRDTELQYLMALINQSR
jgi:C-terminal processing protease CtpA/Prc